MIAWHRLGRSHQSHLAGLAHPSSSDLQVANFSSVFLQKRHAFATVTERRRILAQPDAHGPHLM